MTRTVGTARLALLAAAAIGGLAQSVSGAAGALLAVQVSGRTSLAGVPQAALVAGSALAAVALGRVTERTGRRAALTAGAIAAATGAATTAAAALGANLVAVILGSLLLGAGNTMVMLARYAAADLGPEEQRPRAMGLVMAAMTAGAVVGAALLGPSVEAADRLGAGLAGPYLLAVPLFLVAGAILAGGLPAGRSTDPAPNVLRPEPRPADDHDAVLAVAVLSVANVVMIAVMTLAPVHLQHAGHGVGVIGVVISLHVLAMYAPAPLAALSVRRLGARGTAFLAGLVLTAGCAAAATSRSSAALLTVGMAALGLGWCLALVAGSTMLTSEVPPAQRPRRETVGETSMGIAAIGGGVAAGPVTAAGGYPTLALAAALATALLSIALASRRLVRRPAQADSITEGTRLSSSGRRPAGLGETTSADRHRHD